MINNNGEIKKKQPVSLSPDTDIWLTVFVMLCLRVPEDKGEIKFYKSPMLVM